MVFCYGSPSKLINLYTCVQSSIFHNSQKVEATYVSINRIMDKQNVLHTMEYYSAFKKEIVAYYNMVNLEDIMLIENVSHKRQILCDSTFMRQLG